MDSELRLPCLAFVLAASLLAGCATPVEKSEITPKFYSTAEKNAALSVLEARPYVLSGDKTPKFEGIFRSGFGIPHTVDRPRRPTEERFVDLLAEMVKNGLTEAGVNVAIVSMPVGATLEDTWKRMSETNAGRYVVIRVLESNWLFNPYREKVSYKYDFGIYVGGPGNFKMQAKQFAALEENERSQKYNVFDMHSVRYKQVIESMFADPIIQQALQK